MLIACCSSAVNRTIAYNVTYNTSLYPRGGEDKDHMHHHFV